MITDYLSNRSYWARGRSRELIEKSIANSLCFGLFNPADQQMGFARIVTDFTFFAWLMDVFILEEYRGQGLGKMLISTIFSDPALKQIKRWGLGTRDAHGLYRQFGFKELGNPNNMMERVVDDF
jgi:GNAT superfamily N-acetyltransferase